MTYWSDGLVEKITDRNGHTTTFNYQDPIDGPHRRLESIDIPKGLQPSDGVRTVTFAHNDADNPDNVTKVTDPEGKVTRYEYTRSNLLHKVIIERPSQADRIFQYSYDAAGRLDEIDVKGRDLLRSAC